MSEGNIIEVIVPENLKEPLRFDFWRLRIDNGENVVFDFAKKDCNDQINLISSILLKKDYINKFLEEMLCFLYINNEKHHLDITLFKKENKPEEVE